MMQVSAKRNMIELHLTLTNSHVKFTQKYSKLALVSHFKNTPMHIFDEDFLGDNTKLI